MGHCEAFRNRASRVQYESNDLATTCSARTSGHGHTAKSVREAAACDAVLHAHFQYPAHCLQCVFVCLAVHLSHAGAEEGTDSSHYVGVPLVSFVPCS